MVLLIVWLAILIFSAKPLFTIARRTYRNRVQSSSNGLKSILFSILAHLTFVHLFNFPVNGWLYWVLPVLNVLFVTHILLLFDLVLDRYSVVDTSRFIHRSSAPFLVSCAAFIAMLYYSAYLNDAILRGVCISALSVGLTGFLVTYRNVK